MRKIARRSVKAILWLLLGVVLLVASVYVPPFQRLIVGVVLDKVNSSPDIEVKVKSFKLRFPMTVSVSGVEVYQKGDTMLLADGADVKVGLLPILRGEVDVKGIGLKDVFMKIGHPDSALWLRGRVGNLEIKPTKVYPFDRLVDLGEVTLNGGRVEIAIGQDTTPPTPPKPVEWEIVARKLSLRDVAIDMAMLPAFERISGRVPQLDLFAADINLRDSEVSIEEVMIDSIGATLLTPSSPVAVLPKPDNPYPSKPMSVRVNRVRITGDTIVYGVDGAVPQPGLDFNYLSFGSLDLELDSVFSRGSDLGVNLRNLHAVNTTSGVVLDMNGKLRMDSAGINAEGLRLATAFSDFGIDASVGTGSSDPNAMPVNASVTASVATADLQKLFPSMRDMIARLPQNRDIGLDVLVSGTMGHLVIDRATADIPRHMLVKLAGSIDNLTDSGAMKGHITVDGNISDPSFINAAMKSGRDKGAVKIPPLSLKGDISLAGQDVSGRLKAITSGGDLALDASWRNSSQGYDVDLATRDFPVNSFLPTAGIGRATVSVKAKGRGLDFMSRRSELVAEVDAVKVEYNHNEITGMKLIAALSGGNADVRIKSVNTVINADIAARGNLAGDTLAWRLDGDVARLDLMALGMSDTVADAMAVFGADARYVPRSGAMDVSLDVKSVDVEIGNDRIATTGLLVDFATGDTLTTARLSNRDLMFTLRAPAPLDSLTGRFGEVAQVLKRQMDARKADVDELQRVLPRFDMTFRAGTDNVLHDYLSSRGIDFDSVDLTASNGDRFFIDGNVTRLVASGYDIDDLRINIDQSDGRLHYSAVINNQPGTMDRYANVSVSGVLDGNTVTSFIEQRDITGKVGYHIGANVSATDSTLTLHIAPDNPVIGYMQWHVNPDNFVSVNLKERHIDANLDMSGSQSRVRIFTEHEAHEGDHHQEDINVLIDNIKIEEWISLSPFAPPVKGSVSADIKVSLSPEEITGKGTVTLGDFIYGKNRVGTFDLGVDVSTLPSGALYAKTSLDVDGRQVMEAHGNLNDTASVTPFLLDFTLDRFPLRIANPFLGAQTGTLTGYLNGDMDITGSMGEPKFNGFLQFDSASINLTMLGSALRFSDGKIPVDSNVVRFNDYAVYGVNNNPLTINGTVDMRSLSAMDIDLALKANDMQIIGGKRKKGADMYGNAFISLDATARGNMRFIKTKAELWLLPGTNVTYVIPGGVETVTPRSSSDMVKFVNFADTAAVEKADTIAPSRMLLSLDAILHIEQGSTIGVDLSSDGINRVQMQSNGILDFSMDYMGDTRLTGRLNINKGYFRYNPPVISQFNFDFVDGSYVTFNGALMNPRLDVQLQEKVKANVTQEGQNSRLINFIVGLGVTGTLQNINAAFDLSTDDDITVANELQSMSPEQRANQAMNLLLYNTYTGPGTKASSSISGNPLYGFLESQLNNWMARNVKAVDISFGFDQYDRTLDGSTSTTTSYSYKVSKTFLNDRFKIVVGGNYTTDADPDENLSQNLINDISFEYMLNRAGSMYVRIFRHTGYESILEGEVTQTGVGFVYRRKLRSLRDMFRWALPSKNDDNAPDTVTSDKQITKKEEDEKND